MASRSIHKFARRDPEIYGLIAAVGIMVSAAGYHLGHKSQNHSPEKNVMMNSMPWEDTKHDGRVKSYKYKYHAADGKVERAPHALSSKTVNDHNIPADLHAKFHKEH